MFEVLRTHCDIVEAFPFTNGNRAHFDDGFGMIPSVEIFEAIAAHEINYIAVFFFQNRKRERAVIVFTAHVFDVVDDEIHALECDFKQVATLLETQKSRTFVRRRNRRHEHEFGYFEPKHCAFAHCDVFFVYGVERPAEN